MGWRPSIPSTPEKPAGNWVGCPWNRERERSADAGRDAVVRAVYGRVDETDAGHRRGWKTAKSRLKRALCNAVGVVPAKPAHFGQGTTPEAHAKAAGPLRVLRDHWQLRQPSAISGRHAKVMVPPAVSASPRPTTNVAPIPSPGEAVQSSPRPRGPRLGEQRSEVMR